MIQIAIVTRTVIFRTFNTNTYHAHASQFRIVVNIISTSIPDVFIFAITYTLRCHSGFIPLYLSHISSPYIAFSFTPEFSLNTSSHTLGPRSGPPTNVYTHAHVALSLHFSVPIIANVHLLTT
jgi:hypothetical protein